MKDVERDIHSYDDIIDLPHRVSGKRPRMSLIERAAQFSPFAALTGYGDAVDETARLTDERIELSDEALSALNDRFLLLRDCIKDAPEVTITYYVPDVKKRGGAYKTVRGVVKKVDEYARSIDMRDGARIPMVDIYDLTGDIFGKLRGDDSV